MNYLRKTQTLQFIRQTPKILRCFANQVTPEEPSIKKPEPRKSIAEYRFIYPEFLPDPDPKMRNRLREQLEREDMIARRRLIDIPEFYVGTIMSVTSADPHTPGKFNKFMGICIERKGCGLRADFTLRNIVDHQGVEIMYELYDPSLQKIEVIKLEKRLDDKLFYLRDALPEYSYFDPNMEVEILPEGAPVPINTTKVKLKAHPWTQKWELKDLKGIEEITFLPGRRKERAEKFAKPYEKYDLMKEYMRSIPEEEQKDIFSAIQSDLQKLEITRKKLKRKRTFVKPTKLA